MLLRTGSRKPTHTDERESGDPESPAVSTSSAGGDALYGLLDALIALRMDFANDMTGEKALTRTYGRAKLLKVRATLDEAIQRVKDVTDATNPAAPLKSRRRPGAPGSTPQ